MRYLSSLKAYLRSRSAKRKLSTANHCVRRPLLELLEYRNMLAVSTFPGNECPPDLDLSAVANQQVTVGQLLTVNLFTAGGTIEDLDAEGDPTGDTIRYYLDPDVGTDTPIGASLTVEGIFTWTPTADQAGTHRIVVIAVDSGTPALADAEIFTVLVSAAMPPAVVDLNGTDAGINTTATFTEDGGAVVIVDTDATITDADDTNLESATITLANRPDGEDESLSVTTTGTSIVASYNPATGVLSLTGADTVANYQQVIRTLSYNNVSQAPDTTARAVQVIVNDGTSNSAVATSTVTIQAANDAPSVDLNGALAGTGFTATYTEDTAPVAIVGEVVIGDVDSPNLASATITITNLLDGNAERLEVNTTGTAITPTYTAATGVLSLTGTDSLTNYQQVLRTLKYSNSSQNPNTTARSVRVVVNDGSNDSTPRTATVNIVGANDAPDLADIADQTATVGLPFELIVTATDPENDTLNYQLDRDDPAASMPASAIITKNNDNEAVITWTPSAADGAGPFTFVVLVTEETADDFTDREQFTVSIVTAAPSVDANGGESGIDFATTFTEDGDPVDIVDDEGLTVGDFDSTTLASATVTITNLEDGSAESLAVSTDGTAITASYVEATGVLSLSGVDSLANYQQVLRTLQYDNTSQDPTEVDRIITIIVNDGDNESAPATSTVSVAGVNDIVDLVLPAPYDDESTPVEVILGDTIEFTAGVIDPDNAADEIIYQIDLDGLDGSSIPDTAAQPTITPSSTVPEVLFQWTPDTLGTFSITIIARDDPQGLRPDTETFRITVVAPPEGLTALVDNNAVDEAFASLD